MVGQTRNFRQIDESHTTGETIRSFRRGHTERTRPRSAGRRSGVDVWRVVVVVVVVVPRAAGGVALALAAAAYRQCCEIWRQTRPCRRSAPSWSFLSATAKRVMCSPLNGVRGSHAAYANIIIIIVVLQSCTWTYES